MSKIKNGIILPLVNKETGNIFNKALDKDKMKEFIACVDNDYTKIVMNDGTHWYVKMSLKKLIVLVRRKGKLNKPSFMERLKNKFKKDETE